MITGNGTGEQGRSRTARLLSALLVGLLGTTALAGSPSPARELPGSAVHAQARPRAEVSGSYQLLPTGKVLAKVVSNSPRVLIKYRTRSGRTRSVLTHLGTGAGAALLPSGAKRLTARALATGTHRGSRSVSLHPAIASGTAAGQPPAPATWHVLLLVFGRTDTDYTDAAGNRRHLSAQLPQSDIDALRASMESAVRPAVAQWSGNLVNWEVDYAYPTTPIARVTSLTSGANWVSPNDIRAELAQSYRPGYHDQVMVYWRNSDDQGNRIPSAGWGLAAEYPGYGYTTVTHLSGTAWNPAVADMHTQVWIHEWLHSASHFFTGLGYQFPQGDADGAELAGYAPDRAPYPGWGVTTPT
ncbi:MAG: hypothetical protein ACOYEV_17740 [Candidatus Nanopelagicales bacterium]